MSQLDLRPYFPVVARRLDEHGNEDPKSFVEVKTVLHGMIRLKEVPYIPRSGTGVLIAGMTEVFTTPVVKNTFRVNYGTGRVFFYAADEGRELTITYEGMGSLVATDEINWLYQNSLNRSSFVGLSDTSDFLIPQTYLRVDRFGKVIECSSPTVGRAVSRTEMATCGPVTPYVMPGSPFDIITAYKVHPGQEGGVTVTPHVSGAGTVAGGVWTAPASAQSIVEFANIEWGLMSRLDSVSVPYSAPNSVIRFVLKFEDGYYRMVANDLQYLGKSTPDVFTQGNHISELANLSDMYLRNHPGQPFSLVFGVTRDPADTTITITAAVTLTGQTEQGWEQMNSRAEFNMGSLEWSVYPDLLGDHMLVIGSGHDELACKCDTFSFKDVIDQGTVQVNVEARTHAQVLYRDTASAAASTTPSVYPDLWATDAPPAFLASTTGLLFGPRPYTYDEIPWVDGGGVSRPKPITFVEFLKDGTPVNKVAGGYAVTGKALEACPGYFWGAGVMGTYGTNPNASVKVCDFQVVSSAATVVTKCLGGWFKYVAGSPFILTSSGRFGGGVIGDSFVQLRAETSLRIAVMAPSRNYTTDLIRDVAIPPGWNYIALVNYRANSTIGVLVNDTLYQYTQATYWDTGTPTYYTPDTIGTPGSTTNPGMFLVDSPVAWNVDMSTNLDNAKYLKNTQVARRQAMEAACPPYMEYTSPLTLGDDAVLSFTDRVYSSAAQAAVNESTRMWLLRDNTKYVINYYGEIEALVNPDDSLLFERSCPYSTFIAAFNLTPEKFSSFRLCGISYRDAPYTSAMFASLAAYTEKDIPYILARPGVDFSITYNENAKSWLAKNTTGKRVDALLVISGAGSYTHVSPQKVSDLIDGTDFADINPKTLVSLDGRMQKRRFVHPYLLT